jgi:hypothetical protein
LSLPIERLLGCTALDGQKNIGTRFPDRSPGMNSQTLFRGSDTADSIPYAEVIESVAVADPPEAIQTAQIVELILKHRTALNRQLRASSRKADLATRLLGISLASFVLFGAAMAIACDAAALWPHLTPTSEWIKSPSAELVTFVKATGPKRFVQSWLAGRAVRMIVAYAFGLIAASGVCLPSLYFYGLLSGLRMSVTEVVLHALKAKATAAVALVGILPVYAALVLGVVVFPLPAEIVQTTLVVGLCLPFIAGLWGTKSLYVGFAERCDTMPEAFQTNRACFLRRLVLSWCACYTAVAPIMIATVWQHLGG